MDEEILLGDWELVPSEIEYRSSRQVDGDATPEECRELVSRASRLMSLSPDYSIRHAFDFE